MYIDRVHDNSAIKLPEMQLKAVAASKLTHSINTAIYGRHAIELWSWWSLDISLNVSHQPLWLSSGWYPRMHCTFPNNGGAAGWQHESPNESFMAYVFALWSILEFKVQQGFYFWARQSNGRWRSFYWNCLILSVEIVEMIFLNAQLSTRSDSLRIPWINLMNFFFSWLKSRPVWPNRGEAMATLVSVQHVGNATCMTAITNHWILYHHATLRRF